jgi:ketosteroid isomerase-like protein
MGKLVELFDTFTDGLAEKDLNKVMQVFAPDVEFTVYLKEYKPVKGIDAVEKMMKDEFESYSEYSVVKLFECEKANTAVIEWLVTLKEYGKSEDTKVQGVSIITEKNGYAQQWREYVGS